MKHYLFLLLLVSFNASAQKGFKDNRILKNLQAHITYLADDKLEGRRTGTAGERLASAYIISELKKSGIQPYFGKDYLQPFTVHDGKAILDGSMLELNGKSLELNSDYFPLSFSGSGYTDPASDNVRALAIDISRFLEAGLTNPHFDLKQAIRDSIAKIENKYSAVVLYNSSGLSDHLSFDEKDRSPALTVPVIFVKNSGLLSGQDNLRINLKISIEDKIRTGHNVAGYIDNGSPHTIVLGAHYDHLGYGEDKNSLYSGKEAQIHNGADDNASGTAALLELGRLLKESKFKNNNYILLAFSGEELGLYGSKFFADNHVNPDSVNFMINMDMVGRLNDSTRGLTIGGIGTSPAWQSLIKPNHAYFKVKADSSGSGPSDHTSFYRKNIPVLFFFTGTHQDYHKPSDDSDKINYKGQLEIMRYIYQLLEQTDKLGKLSFTKTREAATGTTSFKVSLGIMPDYTFSGNGVLADGISDNRPAQKAGMKAGDVIVKLGDYPVSDVQTYMNALNKFNKGETTTVTIMRNKEQMEFKVTF